MGFIWSYIKINLFGFIIATCLSTISGLGIILIMRNFHQAIKSGIDDPSFFFAMIGLGLLTYMVFGLIAEKMLFQRTSEIVVNMRNDFCRLIFQSNYEEIENQKNELFSSLVTDINNISRVIEKIAIANRNFIISIGGIIYLVTISWKLSILLLLFLGLTYLLIFQRNRKAYVLDKNSRKSWDIVYHNFHDTIFGIKELSLDSNLKEKFDTSLSKSLTNESDQKVRFRFYNHTTSKFSEIIMVMAIGTMISLSLIKQSVSVSQFGEFLAIALFIMNPLSSSANFIRETFTLKVIADHISEIGMKLDQEMESKDSKPISSNKQAIDLKEVTFRYKNQEKDHPFLLGPITLHIPFNQITLIHGSNGSGKSTLSKIIVSLYSPSEGQICYGKEVIDDSNIQSYRNKISAVFTDNHLFKTKKIEDTQKNRLQELLVLFEINCAVQINNDFISMKGLSSGQSKRLALVLSLIEDKEIYVFDEWAANQDPQFKKAFYFNLIPQLKKDGKTVILITHDDQYFDIADNKIHIYEGKIVQSNKLQFEKTSST